MIWILKIDQIENRNQVVGLILNQAYQVLIINFRRVF